MTFEKGAEVARGKTKILFESTDGSHRLVVLQTDTISAGDGARRDTIAGKGRLAAMTTARVFRYLNASGVRTHYLAGGEDEEENEMLVRRCAMIPLEVVVRGIVAGSYAKRHPQLERGSALSPRVVEFFFKDDEHHDPMISVEEIASRQIASQGEIETMTQTARHVFDLLERAWRARDVALVDLKIEFGRQTDPASAAEVIVADVVDNDSWRIWPHGDESAMLDKQIYRNLERRDRESLQRVKRAYERVAAAVGDFGPR
ncbi:MAG: phosphoribosylaminoimidazolesuccinocarboxamide synthase [Candidatus Tyrphobacter sp.]